MNKIVLPGLILAMASAITGCDQKSTTAESPPSMNQQQNTQPEKAPEAIATAQESITIKHPNGETVVTKNPQRIVTFDLGTLDTLDKLGLANRVIAMPKGNLPDYLGRYNSDAYKNAGGMKEPNFEAIRQAQPDLIIITGRQGQSYAQLADIAPTVNVSIDAKNYLASFKHNVETVGRVFDKQPEVEQAISDLDKKIADYQSKARTSGLKALVIMHNANRLNSANTSVYATIVHDLAGISRADENIEPKRQAIDDAYLSAINPDIIFVVDRSAAIGQSPLDVALIETDAIKNTEAYKNHRMIYLTPDLWYLSGGGLESLNKQLDEVIVALE